MKVIYILGYNFISAVTAILLKNFFGENKDIRIVDLEEEDNLNKFNVLESKEIIKILNLNKISVEDFIFNTNAVPSLGSIYFNFLKKEDIQIKLNEHYKNLKSFKIKNILNPSLKEEEKAKDTYKLFELYKNNTLNLKNLKNFEYVFDNNKATEWLIKNIFIKKLQGRVVKFKINQIIYNKEKYIEHFITNINNGLNFKADIYINCTENLFNKEKTNLIYNNYYIDVSFPYKNKEKQLKNIKKYFAFNNGYLLETYLWNKINITYFFNLNDSTKFEIIQNLKKYIVDTHKINYLNFEFKKLNSYALDKYYNKNIIHLNNVFNYIDPLLKNNIDNIINCIYDLISIFEEKENISVIYKNYFNNNCITNYENEKLNYITFLSTTERNDSSYWNNLFEKDIINKNLNLDKSCVKIVRKYNIIDLDFFEKKWKIDIKILNNKIKVTKKTLDNSIPLMIYMKNIFNKERP